MRKLLFATIVVLLLGSTQDGYGDMNFSAFRCGSNLVTLGMSKLQVMMACGSPDMKDVTGFNIQTRRNRRHRSTSVVKQEQWMYNCGTDRFFKILMFENGSLSLIKDGPGLLRGSGPVRCS